MAVLDGSKKKRKRKFEKRKLLVGTNVEVRHFDEGLKGSWHPGVVIGCKKKIRLVEYTNLLDNDGSSKLMEQISVSHAIEGQITASGTRKSYRSHIRPLPFNSDPQESEFTYGLCVDALVNEAWWEGVIFDHEEGSKERLVFFPDQGDQDRINVNRLRVTRDWDEVSGDWRPRGDWLFIRSLEKCERPLPVSVRQIWYDVRSSDVFRLRGLEWMQGEWAWWDKLVSEAVQENVSAAHGGKAVPIAGSVSLEDGEGLHVPLSKRKKTGNSEDCVSVEVSRDKLASQSSHGCADQVDRIIQPVNAFPFHLRAATPVAALDVAMEDGGCRTPYPCDDSLPTSNKIPSSLCSDSDFVVPDTAVNFSSRNVTSETVNGDDLSIGFSKGLDSLCEEGASPCHRPSLSLPSNLDSASPKLVKHRVSEVFGYPLNDACLAKEMPVTANGSQCDEGPSPLALFCGPRNEMADSDIQTEFQEQSLSECIGNSSSGEGMGTIHPFGEDDDLEAIVQNNWGKTDVICVDQGAESNSKSAFWEGEAHEASGQNESWKSSGKYLLPGGACQAIRKYSACAVSSKNQCGKDLVLKTKMDLLSMSRKFEIEKGKHPLKLKLRYVSPENTKFSLPKDIDLKKRKRGVRFPRNGQICVTGENNVVFDNRAADTISNPVCGKNKVCQALNTDTSWKPSQNKSLPKAEYSPLPITEYCACVAQEEPKNRVSYHHFAEKAKMHLDNKCYRSLHQACIHMERRAKNCQCIRKSICEIVEPSVESFHPEPISVAQEKDDAEGNHFSSYSDNQVMNFTKEVTPAFLHPDRVFVKPEHCPQAVEDYLKFGIQKRKDGSLDLTPNENTKHLRSKAKMHLSADGWSFFYKMRRMRKLFKRELRYRSPNGRLYISLRQACVAWVKNDIARKNVKEPQISLGSKDVVNSATSVNFEGCNQLLHRKSGFASTWSSGSLRSSELGAGTVQLKGIRKQRKRRDLCLFSLPSELLDNDRNVCSPSCSMTVENATQDKLGISAFNNKKWRHSGEFFAARKLKKKKLPNPVATRLAKANSSFSKRVLRSNNREPHIATSCSSQPTIRTILSWLIDNDVLLPRQKVWYKHKKDDHVMAEGQITREGIRCKCCKKVYSLCEFEAHAGSTNHRPAANIFLEDGRSLLQCQLQIVNDSLFKGLRLDTYQRIKGDYSRCKSDYICSICHYGGDLILCDYCPSAFHLTCIGLQDVPEGKWSCSSCRCGICGESEFNADSEQFTAQTVLYCDQCEFEFHVGCLRKRGLFKLQSCPQGNWFCSKKCSKIFVRLQKLLGKSKPTAVKGLSWTILRSKKVNGPDLCSCDDDTMTEHHSKLCVATNVLHECFIPIIEHRTKSDLVTDVLSNRRSELKRLNFRGFYTVILERGDELISVAAIRIHGDKVAEIPLVGTCIQYRRQGMCRLLLNEVEKMLGNLSVERLLLPAAPQLLETWTTSFGFSKMTSSDRLQFLQYTFLDFQDTAMCQKLLMSSTKAMEPRGTKVRHPVSRNNERYDSDRSHIIPESFQTEEPVMTSPSVDVLGCPQDAELCMGSETSAPSLNGDHGSGSMPSIRETSQIDQRATDPISVDVGTGEDSITPAITEMVCPAVVAEQMMDLNCKFQGRFYHRKKDTGKQRSSRTTDPRKDGMFVSKILKCYRRRCISSSEKPPGGSLVA